jgi:alpha-L-rhamnosidase
MPFTLVRLGAALVLALLVRGGEAPDWPSASNETRPWTRWWWLGSAVDEAGLTAELEAFRAAGIGGVEITPIYGARGAESRFVPYLSDRWMQLLEHTLREARRLDLGVDMATGTGWPFGGPWVGADHSCRSLMVKTWTVAGGERLEDPVRLTQTPLVRALGNQIYEVRETGAREPAAVGTLDAPLLRPAQRAIRIEDLKAPVEANHNLQALALEQVRYPTAAPLVALVAYSRDDAHVDLTGRVRSSGVLDWTAPVGTWTLYGVFAGWHGKLVERAAPGGEGNVIDHFSRDAILAYLDRFDRAFANRDLAGLRAFFNDSYEVDDATGQADGTWMLFDEFQRRRGYDLRGHLPGLVEPGDAVNLWRVGADYRLTISDLLLDTFTTEWSAWAKRHGRIVRNQAHGSPANLLDLYAASDIPETEGNEPSRFKWATSAAHVAGRRLVSAEAATWLGEHFRSTLADVRAALDMFFVAGVNHIVYHGSAYSPSDARWPGWQFYASVEFNRRNTWWEDFGTLNAYVTRVQSFLQSGEPDQDVLLYYPFYDFIRRGRSRLVHFGRANEPEVDAFGEASVVLRERGYTFDYISDRQLAATSVADAALRTGGGGAYKTLIVPGSQFIPLETFERILSLARAGATVIFFRDPASDVAGFADLERRNSRLRQLKDEIRLGPPPQEGVSESKAGAGRFLLGNDLDVLLARANVSREPMVDAGLQFTRRRAPDGERVYFILNPGTRELRGWFPLADRAASVLLFNPMTGGRGDARVRSTAGMLEVYLSLDAGESIIAQTAARGVGDAYQVPEPAGPPIDLRGPWSLEFVRGGPALPAPRTLERLGSWTRLEGNDVTTFSGTAVYRTTFARPAGGAASWRLDLGRVESSARVTLNGRDLGTLIGPTFAVILDSTQLTPQNTLDLYVTNLMANRIASLDRSGVRWKTFYNVNFPARFPENRGPDGLFSAAKWEPADSGLLGPVTLTPLVDPSRTGR